MNIEVLFYGQFREITSTDKTTAAVTDGGSLSDLLEALTVSYGPEVRREAENMKGLRILVNGREYFLLGGMKTPLKEGDTVVLLPPLFGG